MSERSTPTPKARRKRRRTKPSKRRTIWRSLTKALSPYSLIDMNVNISELEDVLGGYDKYASDAVKYALYRSVDLKEE